MKRFLLYFSFLCALFSSNLLADVNLSLEVSAQSWTGASGHYDPYDTAEYEQVINFNTVFEAGDNGNYFVTFSPGLHASSGYNRRLESNGDTISYQIYRRSGKRNELKELPTSTGSTVSGKIKSNDTPPNQETIYWVVTPEEIVPSGTYTDSVSMNIYEGVVNNYDHDYGPISLNLSCTVPAFVFLSLVDLGGAFDGQDTSQTMDFQNLVEGEFLAFDMMCKGNTGYTVTMQSGNSSNLSANLSELSQVPYSIEVGGSLKDLTSGLPVEVISHASSPASSGDRYEVKVTIGSVQGAFPGTHTDTINVSIAGL